MLGPLWGCAVLRRRSSVGANLTRGAGITFRREYRPDHPLSVRSSRDGLSGNFRYCSLFIVHCSLFRKVRWLPSAGTGDRRPPKKAGVGLSAMEETAGEVRRGFGGHYAMSIVRW